MTIVSVKLDLDPSTLAWVDIRRGDLSRSAWIKLLVEADHVIDGSPDYVADANSRILERAVNRATTALTLGRPGYAEFLLRRAEMATTAIEELAVHLYDTAPSTAPSTNTDMGNTK